MTDDVVTRAIEVVKLKSQVATCTTVHPITINFHPDRFTRYGKPLLLAMAEDGIIKSQFETGTSNGGLSAHRNGARWRWEQQVFEGVFDESANNLRPKYGALNYRHYETGASARFGSAYFILKRHILNRATFCFPDSHLEPSAFGVKGHLSALIEAASQSKLDLLDDYIEAQIHGVLSIQDDVECLVLDPVYRFSKVEEYAQELQIPLEWHNGYELDISEMRQYPDYRGSRIIDIAEAIAENGSINVKRLGVAIAERGYDEQDVKKVWHYLARFGYRAIAV